MGTLIYNVTIIILKTHVLKIRDYLFYCFKSFTFALINEMFNYKNITETNYVHAQYTMFLNNILIILIPNKFHLISFLLNIHCNMF